LALRNITRLFEIHSRIYNSSEVLLEPSDTRAMNCANPDYCLNAALDSSGLLPPNVSIFHEGLFRHFSHKLEVA
jgi:hypothetical protein